MSLDFFFFFNLLVVTTKFDGKAKSDLKLRKDDILMEVN